MLSILKKLTPLGIKQTCMESMEYVCIRNYAARKGTRERKSKKKVKVVVEKVGFIPHSQRNKEKLLANRVSRKFNDSWKMDPIDEIYCLKYYKWKNYPFEEAVQCHRETHHPEIYNQPNAPIQAIVELNMQGEKKAKFIENFTRICGIPHRFDHGEERTIIAFAKESADQKAALDAGARLAGGADLVKNIQNGNVSLQDFEFVIAHPDILPELSSLRGLLKKKFPNPKMGTLGVYLNEMVENYLYGINYTAIKDEYEKDFGVITTQIGTLDMNSRHLEENFAALLKDIMIMKPKRAGDLITRTLLMSPPSGETFKIDHRLYISDNNNQDKENEDKSEEVERLEILEA